MDYMAAQMDSQIDGAISENDRLREDLFKMDADLTKAKRLLVDLHKTGIVEVQSLIEARTGSWFVWGEDRAQSNRPTVGKGGVMEDKLIAAGVKNMHAFGYPNCNAANIMTDEIYKAFFVSMLNDNKGHGAAIDSAIDRLLSKCATHPKD